MGTEIKPEGLARILVGQYRVPREEVSIDGVDRAVGGRRHQTAVGSKEMHLESLEWDLREVVEESGQLPGYGIGPEGAYELGVDAEARSDEEQPVLVVWLGFADVDGANERRRERLGPDLEGADLRAVRAMRGALAVEVRLGVGAGGLAVSRIGIDREPWREGDGRRLEL